jgi:hypothetical protein
MEQSEKKKITAIKEWSNYILHKWKLILLVAVIGGLLGLGFALLKKVTYKSELTFVLSNEDNNDLSSLTSQFGISLGSGGDVFSADNIVSLFTSRKMVNWALFQKVPKINEKLLDLYVKENKLDKEWGKKERYKNVLPFPDDINKISPLQDSLLREIHKDIISKYLAVERPNTKLSFFTIRTVYSNEVFSCYFTKYLVDATAKLYIDTKTSQARLNLQMLQGEADSIHALINGAITATGSATDQVFNLNPALQAERSPIYKSQFRAQVNEAAYGEVLKNLELAKITLQKQSPIYLILDEPHLPLERIGQGKLMHLIAGLFIGPILAIVFIVVKRIAQDIFGTS